ncbi:hypothetical protein MKEN_00850100 [Mycena kentingensis (nom. inval.)]|nr:hypothetical protein MKEN_00850100 [Mycena kentingensis (nom. inval.)]
MKSCLKTSPKSTGNERERRVSFGEKDEVFVVDNWDRTPSSRRSTSSMSASSDMCDLDDFHKTLARPDTTVEWPTSVPIELFAPYNSNPPPAVPPRRERARSLYAPPPRLASTQGLRTPPVNIPPRFAASRRCPAGTFKPAAAAPPPPPPGRLMIVNGMDFVVDDEDEELDREFGLDAGFLQHGYIPFGSNANANTFPTSPHPSPPSSPISAPPCSPSSTISLSPDPFAASPRPRPPRMERPRPRPIVRVNLTTNAIAPHNLLPMRSFISPVAATTAASYVSVPA